MCGAGDWPECCGSGMRGGSRKDAQGWGSHRYMGRLDCCSRSSGYPPSVSPLNSPWQLMPTASYLRCMVGAAEAFCGCRSEFTVHQGARKSQRVG